MPSLRSFGPHAWPIGASFFVGIWILVPILGTGVPFLFLIGAVFLRDRSGPVRPELKAFALLCLAYVCYILGRGALAGDLASLQEPAEDALPVLLTALIAVWVLRSRSALPMGAVYKVMVVAQIGFCIWASYVYFGLNIHRPPLLSGNPFNWAPLLLVPALLSTDSRLAPNRLWYGIGLLAFAASAFNVGGISESRGPFLVLTLLVGLRIVSEIAIAGSVGARLRRAGAIVLVYLMVITAIGTSSGLLSRIMPSAAHADSVALQTPEPLTPWISQDYGMSLFLRGAMVQSGWHAFLDAPVFGHGPQYRVEAAARYFPPEFIWSYSHLHNDFITHAVAGGLVAVGLLTLMLAFPLIVAFRYTTNTALRREIGLIFTLSFAGIALVNNVLFVAIWGFMFTLNMIVAFLLIDSLSDQPAAR